LITTAAINIRIYCDQCLGFLRHANSPESVRNIPFAAAYRHNVITLSYLCCIGYLKVLLYGCRLRNFTPRRGRQVTRSSCILRSNWFGKLTCRLHGGLLQLAARHYFSICFSTTSALPLVPTMFYDQNKTPSSSFLLRSLQCGLGHSSCFLL
jgi:hypothetical protein